jgi:hypothetical protein
MATGGIRNQAFRCGQSRLSTLENGVIGTFSFERQTGFEAASLG